MTVLHQTLDASDKKNVFVCGDIHGEFALLQEELDKLNFNPETDILISVGDLCDRGPDSMAAFDYIDKPWFYRVLGNHDVMLQMYLEKQATKDQITSWGGAWFVDKPDHLIEDLSKKLIDAPHALTVITPKQRRIGVVHADCLSDWGHHLSCLDRKWGKELSLWKRYTIKRLMKEQDKKIPFNVTATYVSSIDHVFHGHTVLGRPLTVANRSWIDTGACFGFAMTCWNIDDFLDYLDTKKQE